MADRNGIVMVALSGGVDSAVAALRLKELGYEVQCLHMSNWEDDGYCEAAADFQDARALCRQLDLPLHRVSFANEYRDQVFAHFLAEYRAGRTPNPDVLCNRQIKFGVMRQYAKRLGARWVATGHYARLRQVSPADECSVEGRPDDSSAPPQLLKGIDASKDQSYFLHRVAGDDLVDVLFPVGELDKTEVRAIASRAGLPVAAKKDSTGICFIGERPFAEFLSRYVATQPGPIVDPDGRVLGEHQGLAFYTLGQRQGLRIGGRRDSDALPWYVAAKDAARNELLVVQGKQHPLLFHDSLTAEDLHWTGPAPAFWHDHGVLRCAAKTRYRQPDQPCTVMRSGDNGLLVTFDQSQRAVTPGQYVVLYDGELCLGGAVITAALRQSSDLRATG